MWLNYYKMANLIKRLNKPCLCFKILAAGRNVIVQPPEVNL